MKKKAAMPNPDEIEFSDEEMRKLEAELRAQDSDKDLDGETDGPPAKLDEHDLAELNAELESLGGPPAKAPKEKPQEGAKKPYNPMEEVVVPKKKEEKKPASVIEEHSSIKPEKANKKVTKMSLVKIEDTFHGLPCIFGDAIEEELNKVLPEIQDKYMEATDETVMEYVMKVNQKMKELIKFKQAIIQKSEKGELTEQKYKELVEKAILRNNEALMSAQKEDLPQADLNRIKRRLDLLANEIKKMTADPHEEPIILPVVEPPTNKAFDEGSKEITKELLQESVSQKSQEAQKTQLKEKNKEENIHEPPKDALKKEKAEGKKDTKPISINPEPKKEEPKKVEPKKDDSKKDEAKKEEPKKDEANKTEKKTTVEPGTLHMAQRIAAYMSFTDYLKEYFSDTRADDLKKLNDQITQMKAKLTNLKSGTAKMTPEEVDAEYPALDTHIILGMSAKERNTKIQKLVEIISQELNGVQDKQLKAEYTKHYVTVIKNLKEIADSPFGVIPKIEKKTIVFPYNDSNPQLSSSQISFKPLKLHPILDQRYFYITFEFEIDEFKQKFESDYCASGGHFDWFKVIDLGDNYGKKLLKTNVRVTLHKKKFVFSSRTVSTTSFLLDKLTSLCTFKITVVFPYKNNTTINCDIQIQTRKAFGKPSKEIELMCITKTYPIFQLRKITGATQPAVEPTHQATSKTPVNAPSAPQPPAKPQPQQKPKKDEQIDDVDKLEKMPFKFPLIPVQMKKKLAEVIAKNKYPQSYIDFEDKMLCITYLEKFSTELESQITSLNVKGDRETAKAAQNLYMACRGLLKNLESQLTNGKLTQETYVANLEKGLLVDQKLLEFYKNAKIPNAIVFLTSRLETLKEEIEYMKKL